MSIDRFASYHGALSHAPSRRDVLRGVAGAGLGLGIAQLSEPGAARKKCKRKKRHKKRDSRPRPKPNAYGCLDIGEACDGDSSRCCSGICAGNGPTRTCVAHHEIGCDAADTCSESVPCGATGVCYRTTGQAGFCGDSRVCNCLPCRRDTDCEPEYGPGAACVVCTGDCAGINHSEGTSCVPAAT